MKDFLLSALGQPRLNERLQRLVRPVEQHQRVIEQLARDRSYRAVLDYGCGEGLLCGAFDRDRYTGYDLDERKVSHARHRHAGYSFQSQHIQRFDPYDLFLFGHVLHHMGGQAVEQIFDRIAGECRPGTRVLVLEVRPASTLRSIVLKAFQKLEEALKGVDFRQPEQWAERAGRERFVTRQVMDLGAHYVLDLELTPRAASTSAETDARS